MRNFSEVNLTEAVLGKVQDAADRRFRQVMTSLVQHLHDFVREVELTPEEWRAGIEFLTATGKKCDDNRQEFILLSDTLGVSMLLDAINHRKPAGATETTVLGPFHVEGAPRLPNGADISSGAPGEPTFVSGRVLDIAGRTIAGAELDIWQTDGDGFYDVQRPDYAGMSLRGRFLTDKEGRFCFRTVKPVSYPIPADGPVGKMLRSMGRHPYRPAHLHAIVAAPRFETVVTHLFVANDRYLDSDAVFGVKDSLVVDFVPHGPGLAPDGSQCETPFYTCDFDFRLAEVG